MKLQIKYDIGNNVYVYYLGGVVPAKVDTIEVEAWQDNINISYCLMFEDGNSHNFTEGEIFADKQEATNYLLTHD
ncbi:hypothetical protein RCZ04_03920 [Capnocytophaga sp. HP1101]